MLYAMVVAASALREGLVEADSTLVGVVVAALIVLAVAYVVRRVGRAKMED